MKAGHRSLAAALYGGNVLCLVCLLACRSEPDQQSTAPQPATGRIVSLAPALTESLFAIGAGEQVVGVSNYCTHPAEVEALPKAGTSITPNYEAIARLSPTLIVTEEAVNTKNHSLGRIAKVAALPWLALDQVTRSVRRLGELTGRRARAERLAQRFSTEIEREPPPDGPRVLLVLGYQPGPLREVWYIRENSLHGAALHAAGARNAVDEAIFGQPRLSLEALIELDPDRVIVLTKEPGSRQAILQAWTELDTLGAVQRDQVGVLAAPEAFAHGPRIFDLVGRLKSELERLEARPR